MADTVLCTCVHVGHNERCATSDVVGKALLVDDGEEPSPAPYHGSAFVPALQNEGHLSGGNRAGNEGIMDNEEERFAHDREARDDEDDDVYAPGSLDGQDVDKAILEALCNPRERATALRIDADVEKFVTSGANNIMEFPVEMTKYQRLLAHRIAQHYGLQTSSVTLARGLSRVVAQRSEHTSIPKLKITDLKDIHCPPETTRCTTEVTIKRRQGGPVSRIPNPPEGESGTGGPGQARSVKVREQEYKAARERILGRASDSGTPSSGSARSQKENGADKNLQKMSDDARSKAVFRNREREMQDPDYRRGTNRFQRCAFDPNYANYFDQQGTQGLYNIPTYNTEFPALPGQQGVPNITAAPFFPQSISPYGHTGPSPLPTRTIGNHEQSYRHNSSGQHPVPPPPFTMAAQPVYPFHGIPYGYGPDMMPSPAPPPNMTMYPPPTTSHTAVFRGYGTYRGMPGYVLPPMPVQEAMGMMSPMSYPVYGSYAAQPVAYPDYNEMHGQYPLHQHMTNGYQGGGSISTSSPSLAVLNAASQNSSQPLGEPSSPRNYSLGPQAGIDYKSASSNKSLEKEH